MCLKLSAIIRTALQLISFSCVTRSPRGPPRRMSWNICFTGFVLLLCFYAGISSGFFYFSLQILYGFKNQVGEENWANFIGQFPQQLRQRLNSQYEIWKRNGRWGKERRKTVLGANPFWAPGMQKNALKKILLWFSNFCCCLFCCWRVFSLQFKICPLKAIMLWGYYSTNEFSKIFIFVLKFAKKQKIRKFLRNFVVSLWLQKIWGFLWTRLCQCQYLFYLLNSSQLLCYSMDANVEFDVFIIKWVNHIIILCVRVAGAKSTFIVMFLLFYIIWSLKMKCFSNKKYNFCVDGSVIQIISCLVWYALRFYKNNTV